MEINDITYYINSKIMLGYIQHSSCRFYVYVANCAQLIHLVSGDISIPARTLPTLQHTASALDLAGSNWITGPSFLRNQTNIKPKEEEEIPLAVHDPEVCKEVLAHTMNIKECHGLGTERFSRFSNLACLQRAIANLIVTVREFCKIEESPGE